MFIIITQKLYRRYLLKSTTLNFCMIELIKIFLYSLYIEWGKVTKKLDCFQNNNQVFIIFLRIK